MIKDSSSFPASRAPAPTPTDVILWRIGDRTSSPTNPAIGCGSIQINLCAMTLETEEWRRQTDDWTCPGCMRRKRECEVPKGDGSQLRWLVSHHDHMGDYVKEYLTRRYGGKKNFCKEQAHQREAMSYIDRIKVLVKRFTDIVVCIDCNEIEGKIKTRIAADKYFSFHVHEIRRAFKPVANRRHALLTEHVPYYVRFYAAHSDRLVHARKRLVESLIDQAHADSQYWGNATDPGPTFSEHELRMIYPTFDSGLRIAEGLRDGKAVLQGAAWSAEQDEQLRGLSLEDLPLDDIARRMGRTPLGIRFRLDHLGIAQSQS
jgi:hypothetical protein